MPGPGWNRGREGETQGSLIWEAPVRPSLPEAKENARMLSPSCEDTEVGGCL